MRHKRDASCCLLAGMLITASGFADEHHFEFGLAFDGTRYDGSQTLTTPGGTIFNSGETDTDELSVLGSWYFAGLSNDKGPRARAVLVDRASSLTIGYSRTDRKSSAFLSSDDPSFPFPSVDSTFDSYGDSFEVDFRYVDRASGWFGDAGLLTSDTTLRGFLDDSVDATGWKLGVGKYLFETTTLGLNFGEVDGEGGDATVVAVSFSHLANLGQRWQYAVDLGYERVNDIGGLELETWNAALALYPTRDLEFGVAVEDVSGNYNFFDTAGIEGFASWFVTPNVRLSARYGVDDVDDFGNILLPGASRVDAADRNSFGISATIRF